MPADLLEIAFQAKRLGILDLIILSVLWWLNGRVEAIEDELAE